MIVFSRTIGNVTAKAPTTNQSPSFQISILHLRDNAENCLASLNLSEIGLQLLQALRDNDSRLDSAGTAHRLCQLESSAKAYSTDEIASESSDDSDSRLNLDSILILSGIFETGYERFRSARPRGSGIDFKLWESMVLGEERNMPTELCFKYFI